MALTYRQLKIALNELTDEQLDLQASVIIVDADTLDECELHNVHETLLASDKSFGLDLLGSEVFDGLEENLPLLVIRR